METYRVVSITDKKGNPRIEGRYPLRVRRMCKKPPHDCYEYGYRIQDRG